MHSCSTQFYKIIDHWTCAHTRVHFNNDHTVQKYKIHLYSMCIANVPIWLVEHSTTDL